MSAILAVLDDRSTLKTEALYLRQDSGILLARHNIKTVEGLHGYKDRRDEPPSAFIVKNISADWITELGAWYETGADFFAQQAMNPTSQELWQYQHMTRSELDTSSNDAQHLWGIITYDYRDTGNLEAASTHHCKTIIMSNTPEYLDVNTTISYCRIPVYVKYM